MSDRRETASNGRVAHTSLRGKIDADHFTDGTAYTVTVPVTPLLSLPRRRERELLFGQTFTVLEDRDGMSFGISARDGYVGYVDSTDLAPENEEATHFVSARNSYAFSEPKLKSADDPLFLSFGSRVVVRADHGDWSEIAIPRGPDPEHSGPVAMYIPKPHLTRVDRPFSDPANVAMQFLGAPYLWGGNSGFGIDCSGLVQASLLACGVACPGDSDQQARAFAAVPGGRDGLRRGDLIFWKGHVALARDGDRMIHATAWRMSVLVEDIDTAIARIIDQGDGAPTGFGRPVLSG